MTSIIIVTYNSASYIENLLESIFKFNKDSNYEIIVVDNSSTDKSIEILKRVQNDNSKIKIIENKKNAGFAKGINIGVKEAKGEYLLFINPDAKWSEGSIGDLNPIFESDPRVGVVGGRILNKNGIPEKSAGRFLKTSEVFLMTLGLDEMLGIRFSPGKRQEVDFVSGGFMAVRKDLFERLGGFDENFFIYVEDMEFCLRVKKEGLKVLFDPKVSIIHESHGSSNRGFAIENIYKGLLYFHKKHGNALSYNSVKLLFRIKAIALVTLGKIINNKYLIGTYSNVFKI